jgi:hypothetical protein
MKNSDKGFSTDAIVTIPRIYNDPGNKIDVLAESIRRITGVRQVIREAFAPMGFPHMSANIDYKDKEDLKLRVSLQPGNEDLIPFYGMKLLAGRNMLSADSLNEIVINETCSKSLGFVKSADALGRQITWWDGKVYPIVGVIADFHESSYHEPISPVVIAHMPEQEKGIAIKLTTQHMQATDAKMILAAIAKQWKQLYPDDPFECNFLNESIRWLYDQETKTAWLMTVAMAITIFISCMGLFGLALFTAEQRTREIGIRKVLGASVGNIMVLLSKEFVLLVIIALVIASPAAFYFMNQWLQDFAYRIHISWWVFILAGSAAISIALITVSFQAIKAAVANPVNSLRTE